MRLLLPLLALVGAALAGPPTTASVVSVYDGDTFTLDTGDKVRLQWVNTPELRPAEPYGIEARDAAEAFLGDKPISLTYGAVLRDGYGRLLAAPQVEGRWLAEHLLEQGLGHLFLIPPVETTVDVDALLAAQEKARKANRGIWSTDRYQGALHITSFHANAAGDDRENVNGEYLRVCNVTGRPVNLDGYKIADASGSSWTLPGVIVPPGHTFKLHSGQGEHQADPSSTFRFREPPNRCTTVTDPVRGALLQTGPVSRRDPHARMKVVPLIHGASGRQRERTPSQQLLLRLHDPTGFWPESGMAGSGFLGLAPPQELARQATRSSSSPRPSEWRPLPRTRRRLPG